VPIGVPIDNVQIYILDSWMRPLPPGVPGDLFIGGDSLSKGYFRRSELTQQFFLDNPFIRGGRIYKTGDLAKRLSDGTVLFLGRRDEQVKIRGFRIELGEIEVLLRGYAGIREAVVMVREVGGSSRLVGYYVSEEEIGEGLLREYLRERVPEYMVPWYYIHMREMPLTGNGKLDRRGLPEPGWMEDRAVEEAATEGERLLEGVWKEVLGLDRVGVSDSFFGVGGDSIKSVQISSRLRGMGYEVTVADMLRYPTIREQAVRLRRAEQKAEQGEVRGKGPLSPIQRWFWERGEEGRHHYNQSVLLRFKERVSREWVERMFVYLQEHHDGLRAVFREGEGVVEQEVLGAGAWKAVVEEAELGQEGWEKELEERCGRMQSGLRLREGPLMKVGLYHRGVESRLLIVVHHLVVDGVSWRILFEDIERLYGQLGRGEELSLPMKSDSFLRWSELQEARRQEDASRGYWEGVVGEEGAELERDDAGGSNRYGQEGEVVLRLGREETRLLLGEAHKAFRTQVNDILVTAFVLGLREIYGKEVWKIDMEGHGREEAGGVDITRTVGWFTSLYPVVVRVSGDEVRSLKEVKELLRRVPGRGLGYLLHREAGRSSGARISFNYLGQFDTDLRGRSYEIAEEGKGSEAWEGMERRYDWEVSGMIRGGELEMRLRYSREQYGEETVGVVMERYGQQLRRLIVRCAGWGREEVTPWDLSYKGMSMEELEGLQGRYELEDVYGLSPMQAGMLFHALYDGEGEHYFEQISCRVRGVVKVRELEGSLQELVRRHGVLRTAFVHEGYMRPLQVVLRERKAEFRYRDLREEGGGQELADRVEGYRRSDRGRKFDLQRDVLMRLTVLRTGEEEWEMIWSYHHILMDGWCMGILVEEFRELYEGQVRGEVVELGLSPGYGRYISWLEGLDKGRGLSYWREYLSGYESRAGMPRREGKEKEEGRYELLSHELRLDRELTAGVQRVSAELGVTVSTVLQGAWGILLSRYNNTGDVVFGSVVSGRPAEIEGIERMIGLFINTIPVRVRQREGENVGELLQRLQGMAVESLPHHYYPLAEIQSSHELGRDLFDHILIFENFPLTQHLKESSQGTSLIFENVTNFVQTNYAFNIRVLPSDEIVIQFDCNAHVYEEQIIRNIAAHLKNILISVVRDPQLSVRALTLLPEEEMNEVRRKYSANIGRDLTAGTIQAMLERSFGRWKDKPAIAYKGRVFTYGELDAASHKIAAAIQARGLPEGSYIGVMCEDRQKLIATIIGILKTRNVFIPLEVDLPILRLRSIIGQAACRYIITDQGIKAGLDGEDGAIDWIDLAGLEQSIDPAAMSMPEAQLDDRIYVYFTSGSSGEPKGVIGRNKGLSHFVDWEIREFGIDTSFRISQFTNPGFDVFLRDVFVPLCAGATLCIPGEDDLFTGQGIAEWIGENEITLIHCVPSLFRLFAKHLLSPAAIPDLRYILLAGEKILPYELENWFGVFGRRVQLVNIYGPTETTLAKGFYRIRPEDRKKHYIPVTAIPGAQFLLLNSAMEPCPAGVIGEIYIRTPFRSHGYLDHGSMNRSSFVQNPFSNDENDIIYRTGDQGRVYDNGEIEIIGRTDRQVKVRGVRIELDDIRQNLLKYEGITEAAVTVCMDKEGEKVLCAYYISRLAIGQTALRKYLMSALPANMVPSYLIRMQAFPLSPNGKLSLKDLPAPEREHPRDNEATANSIERQLIAIWSELLDIDGRDIGLDHSFFELGGHSIKAFNLLARIQKEFSVKLKLAQVFQYSTVKELSELIYASEKKQEMIIGNAGNREYYAVSPAQERMYYQHLLHDKGVAFNISLCIKINGDPDAERIIQTLRRLVSRHESLRTRFLFVEGELVQQISENAGLDLEILQTREYTSITDAFHAFIRTFDLSTSPVLRCGMFLNSEEGNFLLIDTHHMVVDGVSLNILIRDFIRLYNGEQLPPLPFRYVDYASWIRGSGGKVEDQKRYWQDKLSGKLPVLELPVSLASGDGRPHTAARCTLEISGEDYQH